MTTPHSIHLTSAAEQDLLEAIEWYDEQNPGLGDEFLRNVDAILANISRNPMQFPQLHKTVRRAFVRRFPYGVFYLVAEHRIEVLALFHVRRDPTAWHLRL